MLIHATHAPAAQPSSLADFRPGDSLFASQDRVYHGRGALLRAQATGGVARRAAELLAEAADQLAAPVLLGLLPFDPARPTQLLVPEARYRMAAPGEQPPACPARILRHQEHPSGDDYEHGVREALRRMGGDPTLRKVVLARTLRIGLEQPADIRRILGRLWSRNTNGYTYAIPLGVGGDYFLGASPELLVRRQGRRITLHPLAGTAARHPDPTADARQARALLDSPKDLREHAVVIEAIEAALRPLCRVLDIPARPSLTATARLWHLGTPISGELADQTIGALDLALALHPTPAVCGLPATAARRAIADIEPFERGYFAGAVGWCDTAGDGAWSVAIRCAHAAGRDLTLYAGAGIVPGSIPAQERIETGNKLRTILDALDLDHTL
ncbi:isochorismate synthase [Castellaniella sp. GW247-6E4]|uniref:isochorismate synthase n=1 Tax=Castellaniella sp. GW247-6E4 TaxID=3140380 RepID=UPI0033159C46